MSAELEVADVFRRHGEAYRRARDGQLGRVERRVMSAIELCRTAELGGHTEVCPDCGLVRCAYNSCRNRHCPKCQGQARAEWLAARQAELLPVPYFHVVFTLPAPVAEIAFQNKRVVYAILFRAAAETLRRIAADPRHLGAEIGLVAVLHTWGQNLHHHPHVHCVVPGGGPSLGRYALDRLPARLLPAGPRARRGSSAGSSSTNCTLRSRPANSASSARSPASPDPPPSPTGFARFAGSSGSSMPSRPSAARPRCWPISAAIRIGSPSPTPGWSSITDADVAFRWKDYRQHGKAKVMTLVGARVHPALPAAHPAGRLPSHPPLRLPRQRPPQNQARALPQAACSAGSEPGTQRRPRTRRRTYGRQGRNTRLEPLPLLWPRTGRRRHHVVQAAASIRLLERQLMSCLLFQRSGSSPPGASRVGWAPHVHGGRAEPHQSRVADNRGRAGARQPDQRTTTRRRLTATSLRLHPPPG